MQETVKQLLSGMACAVLFMSLTAAGDEVSSAKRVTDLLQDIQRTMNRAKEESSKAQQELQVDDSKSAQELNRDRAQAVEEFRDAMEEHSREGNSETERDVRSALLKVVRGSTDVIAKLQNEVLVSERQVSIASDALTRIILKMDEIDRALLEMGAGDTPEGREFRRQAALKLRNAAQMTKLLSAEGVRNPDVARILRTLNMQARMLYNRMPQQDNLRKMLAENRKSFEHFLTQLDLAKEQLAVEKLHLAQLALGEIAWGTMQKVAVLLMGDSCNLEQLSLNVLNAQDKRQDVITEFIRQNDQLHGVEPGAEASADAGEYRWLDKIENDPDLK